MSDTSSDLPVNAPHLERDIETRMLAAAYARKPLNLLMTIAVTVIVGGLLWRMFPPAPMTTWIATILAITALGYVECAAFKHAAPAPAAIARWRQLFLIQSTAAGAAWALGPTLMLQDASGAQVGLFIAILLCVCTVAMFSVSEQSAAMQAFIAAALLPPAVALWYRSGDIDRMLALVLVCGMVLISLVGRRFHHVLRQLLETETRTRTILETAMDAVITMDTQGHITDWNQRAESIFGWSRFEAIGLAFHDAIVPLPYRQALRDSLARFLATGEEATLNRRTEQTALRRNGEEFPVELAIVPLKQGNRSEFIAFVADITERQRAALAVQDSEERFRTLIEWSPSAIGVHSDGLIRYVNPAAIKLFGAQATTDLVGQPILDRIHPDFHQIVLTRVKSGLDEGIAAPLIEEKFLKLDGTAIDVEVQGTPIVYNGAAAIRFAMRDNTQRKQDEQAQRIAATAFESQQGMTITNAERQILRVNKAFTEITGYSAEEVIGKNPRLLSSGRQDAAFYAAMWADIARDGTWQGEIWNRRKSGQVFPEWITISAVIDDAGRPTHYVAAFADITSRKMAEDQIQHLAFYNPLTGLPNRRLLMDRLQQALTASGRHLCKGALLVIDLDHFKTLNDTHGHYQGDLLLEQVAGRLASCLGESDTAAHVGGDEFVVMLEGLSQNELEAASMAKVMGEKIRLALSQTYQLDNGNHRSTPSIGVTLFDGSQRDQVDEPLKRAELAMYQAKAAGGNALCFFDPQVQSKVAARAALESDLREAVLNNQFLLHYQAQVVGDARMTGVEALVRWLHPRHGQMSPAEFISLAEDSGLILELGRWVLETACDQLALWAARPEMAHLTIAVNVSARQFHAKDFVDSVLAALERSGANPKRLKLELTETVLVKDVEGVIAKMNTLKANGVGFSLDDFGTGYSSLSYLKRLPLDQLKIDQGFVKTVLTDPNDAAIAKMIIALAESLSLTVIAEGVEIEAQRDFLARQGCHAYQGYLFSRPLPIDAFEAYAGASNRHQGSGLERHFDNRPA